MTTAFDAMLALLARVLGCTEGVATGGSSTTIVDSDLGGTDDEWTSGTAFIITDGGGAGAAPENETARITDYASTTGTITVASGDFSAAPASGDTYGVCKVPRYRLYQALNNALRDLGPVPFEDDTSLDTAASTKRYTLPAAAKRDLRQVWVARRTSAPFDWEEQHNWYVIQNRSTYDLMFREQPVASRDIRLVYVGPHATLDADADTINDAVPLDYLAWRAAFWEYMWRSQQQGRDPERWVGLMNMAAEYASQALQKHPIILPAYSPRHYLSEEPTTELPDGATIKTADVATS